VLWVPCIRIDLPWDAAAEDAHRAGVDLQALVEVLERATVQMVSVAVSAAGLGVLERAGFAGALTQLARLCDARRVELLGTAAHGALLPLMPAREIERQLELNEIANRRWFGDAFRPDCLWAPELAVSHRVAEVASALDYTAMLVAKRRCACVQGSGVANASTGSIGWRASSSSPWPATPAAPSPPGTDPAWFRRRPKATRFRPATATW
jgi:hypothetical protein